MIYLFACYDPRFDPRFDPRLRLITFSFLETFLQRDQRIVSERQLTLRGLAAADERSYTTC